MQHYAKPNVSVSSVESQNTMMTTPRGKLSLPRDRSASSGKQSWVHGTSPRSAHSSTKKDAICQQFLTLP